MLIVKMQTQVFAICVMKKRKLPAEREVFEPIPKSLEINILKKSEFTNSWITHHFSIGRVTQILKQKYELINYFWLHETN